MLLFAEGHGHGDGSLVETENGGGCRTGALDDRILGLEKQLNIELKVRAGAENMLVSYRGGRDKKLLADATQMLTDSKAKIDYLKMRIQKARTSRAEAKDSTQQGHSQNTRKFYFLRTFTYFIFVVVCVCPEGSIG